MLRIGYDAKRLFNNFTGLGNYSRTLLKDLATYFPDNAYFLYSPKVKKNEETHFFLNSALYEVKIPDNRIPAFYWRTWGVKSNLKKHKIQLYHGLSHEIPRGIQESGIKTVVTIHDLIFKRYPQQYKWIDRQIYDNKFRYACQNADMVVAISESTKQDIIDFYQIPAEKIRVIYQSCHERFLTEKGPKVIQAVLEKYGLPSNFLLYVGSIIERKNLLGIVKAVEQLSQATLLPVVIVGKGSTYLRQVQDYIHKRGLQKLFFFIQPEFEDLPALYQKARIFLYPSFCEGFGIPILEALLSRTPVITSNISSLPEAAGPDSCLIDPHRPEQIAKSIENILTDEDRRALMIQKGYEYAHRFQGKVLTKQMTSLYQEILDRG